MKVHCRQKPTATKSPGPIVWAEQFLGFYNTPYPDGVELEDNSNDPTKGRYLFYVVVNAERKYLKTGDWVIEHGVVSAAMFQDDYELA